MEEWPTFHSSPGQLSRLSSLALCFLGVEVAMMKDAYALEFAIAVEIVEHDLVHDNNVALFPLGTRGA